MDSAAPSQKRGIQYIGSEDDTAAEPRKKRSRYAAVACDMCKRRKIKCQLDSSATRCRRCQDQDIECTYSYSNTNQPSLLVKNRISAVPSEAVDCRLARLEDRFRVLQSEFDKHCAEGTQAGTPHASASAFSDRARQADQPTVKHHQPHFLGPTRPAYAFNIARASLQGTDVSPDDRTYSSPSSPTSSIHEHTPPSNACTSNSIRDPLRTISERRVIQLLNVYAEEVSPVYPIFDAEALISQTRANFDEWLATRDQTSGPDSLDLSLVRVAVATAQCFESMGTNEFSRQLVSLVEVEMSQSYTNAVLTCRDAVIMAALSIYYFHADQELLAWRRIGTAARAVLELGLHRKESARRNLPDDQVRAWAMRLFWCIYILDRRWSIGLSLPFTLQDADIDPETLQHDNDCGYLRCMVQYGKICSSLWQSYPSLGSSTKTFSKETVSYLEYQIETWARSVPKDLRLAKMPTMEDEVGANRSTQRLRILLHLRKNHLALLINRHCVLSADSIQKDLDTARTLIETAKNSISVLVHLNNAGTTYTRQQAAYNHFLMTALAIVFLAVCHAPREFGHQCRPAFDSAMKLVRTSAAHGSNSRRLWKSIRDLLPRAQELYANLRSADDRRGAEMASTQRTSQHPGPSQHRPLDVTQSVSGRHPSGWEVGTPNSSHAVQSLMTDPPGLQPYSAVDAWGLPTADAQPEQDFTQMTDHLTELYESFETSNVEHHPFNFASDSGEYSLNDAELTRLFQEQISGI